MMVPSRMGLPLSTVYYRARQLGIARTGGIYVFTAREAQRILAFKGKKRGRKKGGKHVKA